MGVGEALGGIASVASGAMGSNSNSSSTQPYILSGPTVAAAQSASNAQIDAARLAQQQVEASTNSAINALMNQYSTSLTYANPTINTGNQAQAQLNYIMGLPAVSPGAAPTAPTAPNLQDYADKISHRQVVDYLEQNEIGRNPSTGKYLYYGGVGGNLTPEQAQKASLTDPFAPGNAELEQTIKNYLAQPSYDTATDQYKNAQTQYGEQMKQWNQQSDVYDKYKAKGQASEADINSIVSNLPGFQFNQSQGINAIQNAASASGMLNSGNLLEQLNSFGQGLSQNYYNNYLQQLSSMVGQGQQATGLAQTGSSNVGSALSGIYSNLGSSNANSSLAQGQALASSYLTPVANQEVRMFPYTTSSSTQSGGGLGGALGALGGVLGGF